MRKFAAVFFFFALALSGISITAYASDCTKDTLIDRFGDWFGNLGKSQARKNRNVTARKAHRLAECAEKQGQQNAVRAV